MDEKDIGAWGMAEFNFDDAGLPLRGDAGLRYVQHQAALDRLCRQGAAINLVTATRNYDSWLPSANVVFDVTDKLLVRLAAAKTMARGRHFGDLPRAATSICRAATVASARAIPI